MTAPIRILEIGNHKLFAHAVPKQTDYFFAGHRRQSAVPLGPIRFLRVLGRLRRKEYDLVVLHSARFAPWHPRTFLPILRDRLIFAYPWLFAPYAWRFLHWFHNVPTVAIDLSDTFGIARHNFFLLDHCHAFYKRELPTDRWLVFFKSGHWDMPGRRWRKRRRNQQRMNKLKPISYGAGRKSNLKRSTVPKTTDVFFAGDLFLGTTPRLDGFSELKALASEGFRIDLPEQQLPHDEYLKRLGAAWLAWSPAGYGWDCERHYEAAQIGAVALSNYPTILRDHPFRDGEHCLFYAPEPGELSTAIRKALEDKPRLQQIADAAYRHVNTHHTPVAWAERIAVTVLGRRLDGSSAAPAAEEN